MTEQECRGDARLSVSVVTTTDEMLALRATWEGLFAITPGVSGFQSAAWVMQCWLHLRKPADRLFIAVMRRDSEPMALFPTQLNKHRRLTFIGHEVSNYCGPVYELTNLEHAMSVWLDFLRATPEVRALDLSGLREDSPAFQVLYRTQSGGWGRPSIARTFSSPEVELTQSWDAIYRRRSQKTRAKWNANERRLAELGEYQFVETADPADIAAAMPRLTEIYRARWEGTRVAVEGAFSPQFERFQAAAAGDMASDGHVLLSLLKLDGEIIAFNYGIRAAHVTASYVIGYDRLFTFHAVGMLLLLRVLESASRRGDPVYDFSLGNAEFKAAWATRQQAVFRLLWGRGRRRRACWRRLRANLRSVRLLRRMRVEGIRGLRAHWRRREVTSDAPGLAAGDNDRWFLYRVMPTGVGLQFRPGRYVDVRQHFSPRLRERAIERNYRGDTLLVTQKEDELLGAVWVARRTRRELLARKQPDIGPSDQIFYHPVAHERLGIQALVGGLASDMPCVVASPQLLRHNQQVEYLGCFLGSIELKDV